ncbi:hypothetical protein [Geminocystis sp. NIES-3709]|uniref:hypothetical protein n=1 Tax=Geminocystis sp. NIES-3709 TaxID=1617448 RepID=UPI0005FC7935|nr:hypothetical protein [Geminocystis sp. NIES-3709]BAQ65980.1 hypothetical protein GM3709_2745 [Geminocystis sp. NIES-3709]
MNRERSIIHYQLYFPMSLPPSSTKPYKSRLFNFVNRHYIKFNSKVNLKIRELGYVVQGSLQTLILPLFWLWETTKKITNSFTSPSRNSASLPPTENSNNLTDNSDLILIVNQAINSHAQLPSLPPKKFQGLASRLKDKKIIFVLENNKFKDIIPIKQQSELNLLINNLTEEFIAQKVLNLSSQSNIFTKIFSWFNLLGKSKVETKISQDLNNLESSGIALNNNDYDTSFYYKNNSIILFLDNILATLESLIVRQKEAIIQKKDEQLTEENKEKLSLLLLIKAAIEYFFKSKNNQLSNNNNSIENLPLNENTSSNLPFSENYINTIIGKSQARAENIIPQIQETTEQLINQGLNQFNIAKNNLNNKLNNPEDPFQIQILIWAAINYFLSQKNSSKKISNNNKKSFLPSFSETEIILINDEIVDPWLLWEDLYINPPIDETETLDNFLLLDSGIDISIESSETLINNVEITTSIEPQENLVLDKKISNKIDKKKEEKTNNLVNKQVIIEDEIEAKVIEIKYEKHFLEIILEKLDRIILWLEETIIKIVNKIKSFTEKFNK